MTSHYDVSTEGQGTQCSHYTTGCCQKHKETGCQPGQQLIGLEFAGSHAGQALPQSPHLCLSFLFLSSECIELLSSHCCSFLSCLKGDVTGFARLFTAGLQCAEYREVVSNAVWQRGFHNKSKAANSKLRYMATLEKFTAFKHGCECTRWELSPKPLKCFQSSMFTITNMPYKDDLSSLIVEKASACQLQTTSGTCNKQY